MKKLLLILFSLIICMFLIACSGNAKAEETPVNENTSTTEDLDNTDDAASIEETGESDSQENQDDRIEVNENQDNSDTSDNTEDLNQTNLPKSKLNGFPYEEEDLEKRIICISIDNHPKARPQAGLSLAEIVYEFEVEGTYTRYMGVFQAEEPKRIGPVRSARPYLVESALSYDALFCHCGGSNDAFKMISNLAVANIDGLFTSSYWRYNATGKYAPHDLYTTIPMLRDYAKRANYRDSSDISGFSFNEKDADISTGDEASIISIDYNDENNTTYEYEKDLKKYARFKDGKIDYDENTGVQLFAKNILVIEVSKTVLDDEGRLALTVVGSGDGYYFTNNQMKKITWKKTDAKSELKLYDETEDLMLNPGSIWIQVVSQNTSIKVDEVDINE